MSSLIGMQRFKTKIESQVFVIEFDATPSEVHTGASTPTDHPVEDGSIISDHVMDQPDEIEITGQISNRPIRLLASQTETSFVGNGLDGRAAAAWEIIRTLRKSHALVTVATEFREYTDFLIVSDSVSRDARTGRILDISIRLRQFRKATIETAEAPEPIDPVDKPGGDLGPKPTKQATPRVEEESGGMLTDAAEWLDSLRAP